jgi:hypothetical protein
MPQPLIGLASACLLAALNSSALSAGEPGASIEARNLLAHVGKLASDEFAGRAPGTPGETLTIQYLVSPAANSRGSR